MPGENDSQTAKRLGRSKKGISNDLSKAYQYAILLANVRWTDDEGLKIMWRAFGESGISAELLVKIFDAYPIHERPIESLSADEIAVVGGFTRLTAGRFIKFIRTLGNLEGTPVSLGIDNHATRLRAVAARPKSSLRPTRAVLASS